MQQVPTPVAKNLNLDVTRPFNQLLYVQLAIAERSFRFARGIAEGGIHLIVRIDPAHALAAAARRSLEQNRITNFVRSSPRFSRTGHRLLGSRNDRSTCRDGDPPRFGLRPKIANRIGGRPDKCDARCLAGCSELGILAEETVAWMDRVNPMLARGVENAVDTQIAFTRRRRTHRLRLIRHANMQRATVGF